MLFIRVGEKSTKVDDLLRKVPIGGWGQLCLSHYLYWYPEMNPTVYGTKLNSHQQHLEGIQVKAELKEGSSARARGRRGRLETGRSWKSLIKALHFLTVRPFICLNDWISSSTKLKKNLLCSKLRGENVLAQMKPTQLSTIT